MEITEGEFETLLKKEGVDCDKKRDWIDSDFATVFKVVESLVQKSSGIHNVSDTLYIIIDSYRDIVSLHRTMEGAKKMRSKLLDEKSYDILKVFEIGLLE